MRHYWSWKADQAYKEGQGDAERGRRNWEYDCHSEREEDQAYCDGWQDYKREEERRREEREEQERQEMRDERQRQEQKEYERQMEEQMYYEQQEYYKHYKQEEQQREEERDCPDVKLKKNDSQKSV